MPLGGSAPVFKDVVARRFQQRRAALAQRIPPARRLDGVESTCQRGLQAGPASAASIDSMRSGVSRYLREKAWQHSVNAGIGQRGAGAVAPSVWRLWQPVSRSLRTSASR